MKSNAYEKNWGHYGKAIAEKRATPEWGIVRKARETHWDEFFSVNGTHAVLDAGCGLGDYTVYALRSGARVWAFDYTPEMVIATRDRISENGLKAEGLYVGSVTDIPHEDRSFDIVFCLAVLDHLPLRERLQARSELYRVLKPGGFLYLDVPNRLAWHWRLVFYGMRFLNLYPGGKIHFFLPWELQAFIRGGGFQPSGSLGMTFCPPFSGIYTTDIRRLTILPDHLIQPLDEFYLRIEQTFRRKRLFKPFCWHYFLKAKKPNE